MRKKVIAIRFEHIKVVQHDMGNGITEPKFAITDDNIPVIVKTNNGPEGPLVLFNEYFCYRLAILLSLPMPKSGICLIDANTNIYNDCIAVEQYGYGFYSTYLNKVVPLVDTIIPMIKNKEAFYKILLFDHVVFNPDRNPGNLLVQYYKNNIVLQVIDHSHVFINQAIWNANCLEQGMMEKDYFSTRILEDNNYLYGMFFRNMSVCEDDFSSLKTLFREKITETILRHFISDMPPEWVPSSKDVSTLINYILYRIRHIDDICITILKHLNK